MRNSSGASGHQGENEWQWKKKEQEHDISSIKRVTGKSLAEFHVVAEQKKMQRNVQKSVLQVQSYCCFLFLLIRLTDLFWLFSFPSPLSITWFYILFE